MQIKFSYWVGSCGWVKLYNVSGENVASGILDNL